MLNRKRQRGKVGWILLWLVGVPVPILLILFLSAAAPETRSAR